MTDAALPNRTLGLKPLGDVAQLLFCPQAAQLLLPVQRGDAGGVVAAVFVLPQTLQQQGAMFVILWCRGRDEASSPQVANTALGLQPFERLLGLAVGHISESGPRDAVLAVLHTRMPISQQTDC
jgi:hypothetical protein